MRTMKKQQLEKAIELATAKLDLAYKIGGEPKILEYAHRVVNLNARYEVKYGVDYWEIMDLQEIKQ